MNLFAKPVVTWNQPEAFRVHADQRSFVTMKWWLWPLIVFATVAMFTLGWEISKLNPSKHPPDFIVAFPMILALSVGIVYGYPWLLRRAPGAVNLYSFGIMGMGEQRIRSFKEISGYNLSEEGSYHVLRLITKKGRSILYGVPDPMTRDKIEVVLNQAGLSKISTLVKPDFETRRKAIWGDRVFTAAEVEAMREEKNKG